MSREQPRQNHHSGDRRQGTIPWYRQPPKPGTPQDDRAKIAQKTIDLLPDLIASLKSTPAESLLVTTPDPLDESQSPGLASTIVRVVNGDTLDIALSHLEPGSKPPIVLNMASERTPGGGWRNGSIAQEEAICYRSSLYATLHKRFYPLALDQAVYSPEFLVIRNSINIGDDMLQTTSPDELPVLAAISVAALRRPQVATRTTPDGKTLEVYARPRDEGLMKAKMRLILRVAAMKGHRKVILGALGCGAFHNPKNEVMRLWKEVLMETEWRGWFSDLVFAVLDTRSEGNYDIFKDGLDGMQV